MRRHNLPTAKFEVFTDFEKAKAYVNTQALPVVIKASGLALGKGVAITTTKAEAIQALKNFWKARRFPFMRFLMAGIIKCFRLRRTIKKSAKATLARIPAASARLLPCRL